MIGQLSLNLCAMCLLMLPLVPGGGGTVSAPRADRVNFGVYDPGGAFQVASNLDIEERFVPWALDDPRATLDAVDGIIARGRFPLISSESWSWEPWQDFRKETLLADIAQGRYDSTIIGLCDGLGHQAPQGIWLRWGAEMDLDDHKPWQQGDPEAFIAAYRHLVAACRDTGETNIRFVWSPAGDGSLSSYYPGDDVVDLVGLTVYEFSAWDRRYGHDDRSFDDLFGEKYRLVRQFQKPIIVAEMGVSGDIDAQRQWLQDAEQIFPDYPTLKAVVYFNAVNPTNFAGFGETPDWRLGLDLFP